MNPRAVILPFLFRSCSLFLLLFFFKSFLICPSSFIHHPSSFNHNPSPIIFPNHPSSIILTPSSFPNHPSSIILTPSSFPHHPLPIILPHHPSPIILQTSSFILQPSFIAHRCPMFHMLDVYHNTLILMHRHTLIQFCKQYHTHTGISMFTKQTLFQIQDLRAGAKSREIYRIWRYCISPPEMTSLLIHSDVITSGINRKRWRLVLGKAGTRRK